MSPDELRQSGAQPAIPVTPIGYDDASRIMRALDGKYIEVKNAAEIHEVQ